MRWTLATLLLGFVPGGLAAQSVDNTDNTGYGTTAAEFLLLGANARGAALGTPFAAIANDVGALYYNPAGAAMAKHAGVQVSTYEYVADTRYSWGGLNLPFGGGRSAVGLHLGTFGFGDQPVYTVEQPDGTGAVYSVNQTYVGLTYAQNFSDRFSAGITPKVVLDQLGDASGSAFAVDFGTNFHSALGGHPIAFSFTLTNLGTNISYSGTALDVAVPRDSVPGVPPVPTVPQPGEYSTKAWSLPTTFAVALAYDLVAASSTRWTLMGNFNQPINNKAGFAFATEAEFRNLGETGFGTALRLSYSYQPANNVTVTLPTSMNDEENLQGLAFGGGLFYQTPGKFRIGLDYAYRYMGILGGTNFFSLDFGW
jgi:hypothetical protein